MKNVYSETHGIGFKHILFQNKTFNLFSMYLRGLGEVGGEEDTERTRQESDSIYWFTPQKPAISGTAQGNSTQVISVGSRKPITVAITANGWIWEQRILHPCYLDQDVVILTTRLNDHS